MRVGGRLADREGRAAVLDACTGLTYSTPGLLSYSGKKF